MKKAIISILALCIISVSYSQKPLSKIGVKPANEVNKKTSPPEKGTTTFFIDYYQAESIFYGGPVSQGGYYDRFIWSTNMNYNMVLGDTEILYCIVAFDSLYDPYDDVTYDKNSFQSMTIDTIWFEFGHENNSGIDDTLRVKIVSLNSSGYPQESTVLWSHDIIGTAITDTNQYNYASILNVAPGIQIGNHKEFGVVLEYYGHRTDTAGFIAGYGDMGPCNTMTTSAYQSLFYPNSFTLWQKYQTYGILPTSGGGFLYYDCNQNGQYDPGVDGEDFIEDIDIWCKVTVDDEIGIHENKPALDFLGQNHPNPYSNTTEIEYHLLSSQNVTLEIYDICGIKVDKIYEGIKTPGKHKIKYIGTSLPSGIYYYTLIAGENRLTKKMIVQ